MDPGTEDMGTSPITISGSNGPNWKGILCRSYKKVSKWKTKSKQRTLS